MHVGADMALTADRRFRLVNDYARKLGYVSGFPTFQEADYGQGIVGGINLLPANVAEWQDVPRTTYGVYRIEDVPGLFRGAAAYATGQGFPGAYPNCHQQDHDAGVMYGTILIKPGMGESRDVPRTALGNPNVADVGAMMGAAADYAATNGFASAFPTFEVAVQDGVENYRLLLIYAGNSDWRDVPITDLYLLPPVDERTAVILCQFRNADGSLSPVAAAPAFYEQFFFGIGNGGLRDYYADVTHRRVNMVGSVYGWLDIGHTVDEHNAAMNQAQRRQAFNWGMQAARDAGKPVDDFPRQVVVINQDTDWGGISKGRSMLLPHKGGGYDAWSLSRAAHEFGHVLGVADAWRTKKSDGNTVDDPYSDFNCIMSYATNGARYTVTMQGITMEAGPGLNGVYTKTLDGIPPTRFVTVPAVGAAETIMLAPLTHADEEGALLIQIPPAFMRPNTYWVELHDPSNWDRAISTSQVVVHETRPGDGNSYVLEVDGVQSLGSPDDAALITPDGGICIAFVEKIGLQVSVRVWELAPNYLQEVRIAALVANPPEGDVFGERVVIRNDRRRAVNLWGWKLQDEANHPRSTPWTFVFPNFALRPGEDVTVWTKPGQNDRKNLFWGLNHGVWNNIKGDAALLFDDTGQWIDRRTYYP
jgi:hypothetical protein